MIHQVLWLVSHNAWHATVDYVLQSPDPNYDPRQNTHMHRPPLNSLNSLSVKREKHFDSHGEEKRANLTLPRLLSESSG